jgi:hypothetical protein
MHRWKMHLQRMEQTRIQFHAYKYRTCGRLERILTMVYVLQSYWACFGLYPSSCMWKTKNITTFSTLKMDAIRSSETSVQST